MVTCQSGVCNENQLLGQACQKRKDATSQASWFNEYGFDDYDCIHAKTARKSHLELDYCCITFLLLLFDQTDPVLH